MDNDGLEIVIWDASMAMEKREEFYTPASHDFMDKVWLIGDDLVFCYGEGEEGFGIYRVGAGVLSLSSLDFAKENSRYSYRFPRKRRGNRYCYNANVIELLANILLRYNDAKEKYIGTALFVNSKEC